MPLNFECVAGVLSEVLRAIRTKQGCGATIIGLRLQAPEDDPRLHEIVAALTGLRGLKVYIAGRDEERERALSLGFDVVAGTFEEFLSRSESETTCWSPDKPCPACGSTTIPKPTKNERDQEHEEVRRIIFGRLRGQVTVQGPG